MFIRVSGRAFKANFISEKTDITQRWSKRKYFKVSVHRHLLEIYDIDGQTISKLLKNHGK